MTRLNKGNFSLSGHRLLKFGTSNLLRVEVGNKCTMSEQYLKKVACVRTRGYSTDLLDPTQVESKKCSQIQWPVPSINAEPVDIFLGEE